MFYAFIACEDFYLKVISTSAVTISEKRKNQIKKDVTTSLSGREQNGTDVLIIKT